MNPRDKKMTEEFLAKMKRTLISKGHDYADEEDTLQAFRSLEDIGISPELSIFARLTNKYDRLKNFFKNKELKVKDDTLDDTLLDLACYSVLLYLARHNKFDKHQKKILECDKDGTVMEI